MFHICDILILINYLVILWYSNLLEGPAFHVATLYSELHFAAHSRLVEPSVWKQLGFMPWLDLTRRAFCILQAPLGIASPPRPCHSRTQWLGRIWYSHLISFSFYKYQTHISQWLFLIHLPHFFFCVPTAFCLRLTNRVKFTLCCETLHVCILDLSESISGTEPFSTVSWVWFGKGGTWRHLGSWVVLSALPSPLLGFQLSFALANLLFLASQALGHMI